LPDWSVGSEHSPALADPHCDRQDIENNSEQAERGPSHQLARNEPEAIDAAAELAFAGAEGHPVEDQRKAADQERRQQVSKFGVLRRQADESSCKHEDQPERHPHQIFQCNWIRLERRINGGSRRHQAQHGNGNPQREPSVLGAIGSRRSACRARSQISGQRQQDGGGDGKGLKQGEIGAGSTA
jgi:hypothetical protein